MFGKFYLLVIILFVLPITLISQFTITGTVISGDNKEKLTGANILIENTFIATSSGLNGDFTFKNLKKGNYTLSVSYIGFESYSEEIELTNDKILIIKLEPQVYLSDEVIISAVRAGGNSATTYNILDEKQIEKQNTGKDLPYMLQSLPSTVVSSDAGAGVGYTGIRIRGTDLTGINVTLNGVPVNDAESQTVFFVDLPDLASGIDNLKVQRGVGSSSNGAASFGASINIKTSKLNKIAYAELNSAAGSFNTYKNTLKFGSGLLADKWTIDGRLSRIVSDGYIDRASSNLFSGQVSLNYYGKKDIISFIYLDGVEKTYQAWEGTPKDSLPTNRKYNPAGKIENSSGDIIGYYDDQTDNYRQSYYQLHYAHEFNENLNLTTAAFLTKGIGYYQSYKNNELFAAYGLNDTVIGEDTISESSMIVQKWLDNDYYGLNFSLNYDHRHFLVNFGSGFYQYYGEHFGKVVWSEISTLGQYNRNYYSNNGLKNDLNVFVKMNYNLSGKMDLFADLQYRSVYYRIKGENDELNDISQSHRYNFFNPKAGICFIPNNNNEFFFTVGVSNREPNRAALESAIESQHIQPERLIDYELGYQFQIPAFLLKSNLYFMDYKDQLVLTGEINNVGSSIMTNAAKSYRLGLEMQAGTRFLKIIEWNVNFSLSRNKIQDFVSYTDDWTNWPQQIADTIGTTNISFSPSILANSSLSVSALRNLNISLVSNFVGKQFIDNTSNNDRILPAYFVNNILINYSVNTKFIRQIDFLVSLNNIFNTKYESNAWIYPYFYEGVEYEMSAYYPQAQFNMLVGITLKF